MGLSFITAGIPSLGKILWFQYRKWTFYRAGLLKQRFLNQLLTEAGEHYHSKFPNAADNEKIPVQALLKEKKDFSGKSENFRTKWETLSAQFKDKSEKASHTILEKKKERDQKYQEMTQAKQALKNLKQELVRTKITTLKNEQRKKRVKEMKTFIPIHFLEQKEDLLSQKIGSLEEQISLAEKNLTPFIDTYQKINTELSKLLGDWGTESKALKSEIALLEKEIKGVNKRKLKIDEDLNKAYLALGESMIRNAKDKSFSKYFEIINTQTSLQDIQQGTSLCDLEISELWPKARGLTYLLVLTLVGLLSYLIYKKYFIL